jgi:hypothetical protein
MAFERSIPYLLPAAEEGYSLENLGHFAMGISMLLRCYVVDIVTNFESLKRHIMGHAIFDEL